MILQTFFRPFAFMDGQIVEDDNIAARQGGRKLGLDIGIEGGAVHGVVDDSLCSEPEGSQSGDKGLGSPMAERFIHVQSLATRATAAHV